MDQMRNNQGKLQLGYWLATTASTFIYSGDDWAGSFDNDTDKALELEKCLGFLVRGEDTHFHLLDEAMECFGGRDALGEAYTLACMAGAEKYARGNFMLGAPLSQYIDCCSRHLKAIRTEGAEYVETFTTLKGETVTRTLNHWHNVAWNIVMIFEVMSAAPNRDDRLFHMGNFGAQPRKPDAFEILERAEFEARMDEYEPNHDNPPEPTGYAGSRSFVTAQRQAAKIEYCKPEPVAYENFKCGSPDCFCAD